MKTTKPSPLFILNSATLIALGLACVIRAFNTPHLLDGLLLFMAGFIVLAICGIAITAIFNQDA